MTSIIFLGTAGDAITLSTQTRSAGGIIIKTEESQLHLDPGPGALVRAIQNKIDIREHTTVLLSSNSVLTSGGTIGLLYALTYGGNDTTCVLAHPDTFTIDGAEQYVERILRLHPQKRVAVQDIEIISIPTSGDELGYRLFTPETVITYTGNTKFNKDLVEQYKKTDILILPVPLPSEEKGHHQLSIANAHRIIELVKPQLAILTGFSAKIIKYDTLQVARDIQIATGIQTIAAKEGLVIKPQSYSAFSKQKRL